MGNQPSSELDQSLRRIEDLKNKPDQLKHALQSFVDSVPADHTFDMRAEKKLFDILMNLVTDELNRAAAPDLHIILAAFNRLLRVRSFYSTIPRCTLIPLLQAVQPQHSLPAQTRDTIVLFTLNTIAAILSCTVPVAADDETANSNASKSKPFDRDQAELSAKQAFYESKGYEVLINRVMIPYARMATASTSLTDTAPPSIPVPPSTISALGKVLDLLSLDLVDHCLTTRFVGIQKLLNLLRPHLELIIALTTYPDINIRAFSSILLQGYLLHSPLATTQQLQSKVLEEGHLLWYILFAIDGSDLPRSHPYAKYWADPNLTELSRNLLGLLCAGNQTITEVCVHKTIPKSLQVSLESLDADSESNVSLTLRSRAEKETIKNTLWNNFESGRMKRPQLHPQFGRLDIAMREPTAIWNVTTKAELCSGIMEELSNLRTQVAIKGSRNARWDYEGFEIRYRSLERHLRVGGLYISVLLQVLHDKSNNYSMELDQVHVLLAALFQRSVIEDDAGWKLACLRTMAALYDRYGDQLTRDLEILPYFTWLLNPRHSTPLVRDQILLMLHTLLKDASNIRRFVKSGGLEQLLTHVGRVLTLPDGVSIIAASPSPITQSTNAEQSVSESKLMDGGSEADMEEEEKYATSSNHGGSLDEHAGSDILDVEEPSDESSNKQSLLSGLPGALSVGECAMSCLALLKLIHQCGAKMRRSMSEPIVIQTLVRLLMCPLPSVREEGLKLLLDIFSGCAHLVPRLAETGAFSFFVYGLRYGISPTALELMSNYHRLQACMPTLSSSSKHHESALIPFFPRSVVDVLTSQGAEAFGALIEANGHDDAGVGGDNENDLLWNATLRRHLFEVMNRRLGPFRALLAKDPNAPYKFTPPERVRYPSLESELILAGVSLRALNETGGAPEAMEQLHIHDPTDLLHELIAALVARRHAGIDLLHVLTAQCICIRRFAALNEARHYPRDGWSALLQLVAPMMESHQQVADSDLACVEKAVELIQVIITTPAAFPNHGDADIQDRPLEDEENEDEGDTNADVFLSLHGCSILGRTFESFLSRGKPSQLLIQRTLIAVLHTLYAVAVVRPESVSRESITGKKWMRKNIAPLLGRNAAQQHPMLSVVTCKTTMGLALNERGQQSIVESGALLHLIDMAAFYRSAASDAAGRTAAQRQQTPSARGMDEEKRVRLAAASVISLLAGHPSASLQADASPQVQRVLMSLFGSELFATLVSPSSFVHRAAASENRSAMHILRKYLDAELLLIEQLDEWPMKQWTFQEIGVRIQQPTRKHSTRQRGTAMPPNATRRTTSQPQPLHEGHEESEEDEMQQNGSYKLDEQYDDSTLSEDGTISTVNLDDLPDSYARFEPQPRAPSNSHQLQGRISELSSSMVGAFDRWKHRASAAFTPLKQATSEATSAGMERRSGTEMRMQQSKTLPLSKQSPQQSSMQSPYHQPSQYERAPQLPIYPSHASTGIDYAYSSVADEEEDVETVDTESFVGGPIYSNDYTVEPSPSPSPSPSTQHTPYDADSQESQLAQAHTLNTVQHYQSYQPAPRVEYGMNEKQSYGYEPHHPQPLPYDSRADDQLQQQPLSSSQYMDPYGAPVPASQQYSESMTNSNEQQYAPYTAADAVDGNHHLDSQSEPQSQSRSQSRSHLHSHSHSQTQPLYATGEQQHQHQQRQQQQQQASMHPYDSRYTDYYSNSQSYAQPADDHSYNRASRPHSNYRRDEENVTM